MTDYKNLNNRLRAVAAIAILDDEEPVSQILYEAADAIEELLKAKQESAERAVEAIEMLNDSRKTPIYGKVVRVEDRAVMSYETFRDIVLNLPEPQKGELMLHLNEEDRGD